MPQPLIPIDGPERVVRELERMLRRVELSELQGKSEFMKSLTNAIRKAGDMKGAHGRKKRPRRKAA